MADAPLDDLQQRIQAMSSSHRLLAFPILLAVHRLGGSASKKEVVAEVGRLVDGQMTAESFEQLKRRGRFGFTRFELKKLGLIEGESGTWALTQLGKSYTTAHQDDPVVIPEFTLAPLEDAPTPNAPRERVD